MVNTAKREECSRNWYLMENRIRKRCLGRNGNFYNNRVCHGEGGRQADSKTEDQREAEANPTALLFLLLRKPHFCL